MQVEQFKALRSGLEVLEASFWHGHRLSMCLRHLYTQWVKQKIT
jgi:hypothetical protein